MREDKKTKLIQMFKIWDKERKDNRNEFFKLQLGYYKKIKENIPKIVNHFNSLSDEQKELLKYKTPSHIYWMAFEKQKIGLGVLKNLMIDLQKQQTAWSSKEQKSEWWSYNKKKLKEVSEISDGVLDKWIADIPSGKKGETTEVEHFLDQSKKYYGELIDDKTGTSNIIDVIVDTLDVNSTKSAQGANKRCINQGDGIFLVFQLFIAINNRDLAQTEKQIKNTPHINKIGSEVFGFYTLDKEGYIYNTKVENFIKEFYGIKKAEYPSNIQDNYTDFKKIYKEYFRNDLDVEIINDNISETGKKQNNIQLNLQIDQFIQWHSEKGLEFSNEQIKMFEDLAKQKGLGFDSFNKSSKKISSFFQIYPDSITTENRKNHIRFEFRERRHFNDYILAVRIGKAGKKELEQKNVDIKFKKTGKSKYKDENLEGKKITNNENVNEIFNDLLTKWESKIQSWFGKSNGDSIYEPFEQPEEEKKQKELENTPSNFILYGPPGTGKTYKTVDISAGIIGNNQTQFKVTNVDDIINVDADKDQYSPDKEKKFHKSNTETFNEGLNKNLIHFVTFHQNYSYEEFVGGLRPETDTENDESRGLHFQWKPGIFIKACAKALELARKDDKKWDIETEEDKKIKSREDWFLNKCSGYKDDDYIFDDETSKVVLIIDEINRANISRVFGELITLIEGDKRIGGKHQLILTLPNGKKLGVPANLIIMGTMNTADKSLALLDVALRRRFEFKGLFPKENLVDDKTLKKVFKELNKQILKEKKSPNLLIGHSYFMDENEKDLEDIFNNRVIPLLNEYFMGNRENVEKLLKGIVITEVNENDVLRCIGEYIEKPKDGNDEQK